MHMPGERYISTECFGKRNKCVAPSLHGKGFGLKRVKEMNIEVDTLTNKVVLRIANPNDLPEIFLLVDQYHEELEIDRSRTKNALRDLLYIQGCILAEYNGKAIGGVAGVCFNGCFTDEVIFFIQFLFVHRDYRFLTRELIKEVELSMLPTKATKIVYGIPNGNNYAKKQRFMKMLGYNELEVHVYKNL